jgi:hypothetical protein
VTRYLYILFGAKGSLFKANRKVVAQVITTLPAAAAPATTSGTEDIPKNVAEDIFERTAAEAT